MTRPQSAFLTHPRSLTWRKALFQLHSCAGLLLGLYLVLIGITGSSLVFREEMQFAAESPHLDPASLQGPRADLLAVAERMREAYPGLPLTGISHPTAAHPTIRGYLGLGDDHLAVDAHPFTGELLATHHSSGSFLHWLQHLHFDLLVGRTGRIFNGIGAICLLLMCLTGAVLWWPGIQRWRHSLRIDLSRKWKRVNWDLHSAAGFWTLPFLAMWALTGIYFTWPAEFSAAIDRVSPVTLARIPPSTPPPVPTPPPSLSLLVQEAQRRSPQASLFSIFLPASPTGHIRIFFAREAPFRYETTDYHYFDAHSGEHLATWRRGLPSTPGDLFMSWLSPLHFGTFGGDGPARWFVKGLWLLLGLSGPLLACTGAVMYWNRHLSKKWRELRPPWPSPSLPAEPGHRSRT